MGYQIVREMGYTHDDFFRLLPSAIGEHKYVVTNTSVSCEIGAGKLEIKLGTEGSRKLGLVIIPKTEIVFDFENVSDTERMEFLHYFDLRFMKGLG